MLTFTDRHNFVKVNYIKLLSFHKLQVLNLSEIPRQRDLAHENFYTTFVLQYKRYFFYYFYTLLSSRWQNWVHSDDRLCDRPIENERREDCNNAAPLRSGEAKVRTENRKTENRKNLFLMKL